MKKLLLASLICLGNKVSASPYFRLMDISHPQAVTGALLDPQDLGNSEAAALFPVVTHSPKDGCLFPSVVCEDWSPLAIGASMNAGRLTLDVAPLANVLPWVQSAAQALIPPSWQSVQRVLSSNPDHSVTFSAGPVWQYKQSTNRGYFRLFTGLALHF